MFRDVLAQFKIGFILLVILTAITGGVYPLFVTGFAQFFFPWQANGSLVETNQQVIGSLHIGQWFTEPSYFWGRPSATMPIPYNGASSSGSNYGPTNPAFLDTLQQRATNLKAVSLNNNPIPIELVTASASGLDPDISPAAAYYQVPRVANARHIPEKELIALILKHIQQRTWIILGEPRVNVLQLNLALNELTLHKEAT
jgi:K+-transporting ATPase ATPase C chain